MYYRFWYGWALCTIDASFSVHLEMILMPLASPRFNIEYHILFVDQVLVLEQVGAQVLDHTLVLSIENHHICDLWDGCCWLNTADEHSDL